MLAKKVQLGGAALRVAFAAYRALDAEAVEPLLQDGTEARVVDTGAGRQIGRWILVPGSADVARLGYGAKCNCMTARHQRYDGATRGLLGMGPRPATARAGCAGAPTR